MDITLDVRFMKSTKQVIVMYSDDDGLFPLSTVENVDQCIFDNKEEGTIILYREIARFTDISYFDED